MKRLIYFLAPVLFFSSCAHHIVRSGYQATKSDYRICNVVIQKNTSISDSSATKVGEIELRDSGFSTVCNEERALEILKGEACAMDANLIIVTEERRPDFKSSCYRCKAEFYRFR